MTTASPIVVRIPTVLRGTMLPETREDYLEAAREITARHQDALPMVELSILKDQVPYDTYCHLSPESQISRVVNRRATDLADAGEKADRKILGYISYLLVNDPIISMIDGALLWASKDGHSERTAGLVIPGAMALLQPGSLVGTTCPMTPEALEKHILFHIDADLSAHERMDTLKKLGDVTAAYLSRLHDSYPSRAHLGYGDRLRFHLGEVQHA